MRRALPLALAVALIGSACTGGDSGPTTPPTTTTTPSTSTPLAPGTTASTEIPRTPVFADDSQVVPIDDQVRIGTLDNGLTYYIRENQSPGGRAQLRLAVQAGSIQEDPSQRGAAHYLEHMMFNGTERFPANELVLLLQRFGAEFGADINAYTSYEETVYQLELPTDDPDTLGAGFDVLLEWATAVALDPEQVDLERGVLVEEWRLRDQGFWGRYFTAVTDRLLAGTDYEGREPLGDPAEVAATTPEGLRSFFEAWYRTDTMAIVAVGDFDASSVEQLIIDRFGPVAAAADPIAVPVPATEAATEPTFLVLSDPETAETWVELNYPMPAEPGVGTVGAIRRSLAFEVAWTMLVTRLEEASLAGSAPFWNPSFAANPLVRGQEAPGLAAYTSPADLAATAEILLEEVKRARTHGFTEGELSRALDEMRGLVQLAFDERGTTQDRDYADQYVEHFLGNAPIPAAADLHELELRLLDEMTLDQVWNTFGAAVDGTEPFVIVVAPDDAAASTPDEAELREIVERVETAELAPWVDTVAALEALMERPDAARLTSRGLFSDTGLTEVTLENGARVVFLETSIRDDVVVFRAASPGGWAMLDPADVAEAQLASDIALNSGVGDIDQVTLDRTLAGLIVSLTPYITEVEEGFFGEAATDDLEILLQLVHLYMTAPRFERVGLEIAVAETLPFAIDPGQVPDLAVASAAVAARFGGDPRFGVIPTVSDLETLDLTTVSQVFGDRFDDPGDFDESTVEDLARRYLGTVPGPGDLEPWLDVRPPLPDGIQQETVQAGTGQLGGLTYLFATERGLDPDTRIEIDLLELVLQQRLTERIREELSASYSPFTFIELVEEPRQSVEVWIEVSADPDDLEEISAQTLAVLADLRATGPTADELAIAAEQLLRDYELISNEQLAQAVVFSAMHPDEGLSEIIDRIDRTFDPTAIQIRDLARQLLSADRYIEVRLVPIPG